MLKHVMARLAATFPRQSIEQTREEERKVWPALPVAALVLVWFLDPLKPFLSPALMATAGLLTAIGIVGYYAIRVLSYGRLLYILVAIALALATLVFLFTVNEAIQLSIANQQLCVTIEREMLRDWTKDQATVEVFQTLHCRPTGG